MFPVGFKVLNYSVTFNVNENIGKKWVNINPFFPMHPFSTPWKHQKTVTIFDVFRG